MQCPGGKSYADYNVIEVLTVNGADHFCDLDSGMYGLVCPSVRDDLINASSNISIWLGILCLIFFGIICILIAKIKKLQGLVKQQPGEAKVVENGDMEIQNKQFI